MGGCGGAPYCCCFFTSFLAQESKSMLDEYMHGKHMRSFKIIINKAVAGH